MCLILFSYKTHPKYKLIVAANRDEFYERPTAIANYWKNSPNVLAGRDLEAKGTWMGMNKKTGAIAMLTNYRDLSNIKPNAPSRGDLVADFLIKNDSAEDYFQQRAYTLTNYNGFNLIIGQADRLYYTSNEFKAGLKKLPKGTYGLSNHLLNTEWPKVKKGKLKLEAITEERHFEVEHLFEALYDDEIAQDNELPDTGVGLERERWLSPLFIKSPKYGTRCSTVILVDNNNKTLFAERTYDTTTFKYDTKYYKFKIGE
ncbi:MAG: NRDE family protein [Cyclobacteriaceae bacterium]|nr:NRDE family protein [Cyclobacteriaceae bacterium]